jgi:START domain
MTRSTTLALLASILITSAVAAEAPWRVILQERGIVVSTREEPGRELPTFRGQGTLNMPVLHALAVVLDAEGAVEWARGADEVRTMKAFDPRTHLIYTRSHAPWPVSDRDMVVKRLVKVVDPGREFRVEMSCVAGQRAEIKRVVRVSDCTSHFILRSAGADRTYAEYQVSLDPAGNLPAWLVRWASKNIPFDTLIALEEHVKDTQARYAAAAQSWASAR